jgi:hypothetical protein
MRRVLFVALFVALAQGAPAALARAERPDFSGSFEIDLKASDSFDELLKAQGASWLERKAAGSITVMQIVRHQGDALEVTVRSSVGTRKDAVRIGSGWEVRDTEHGKVRTRTDWTPDGQSLVTRSEVKLKGDRKAELLVTRSLTDGGKTTVQAMELRIADGKTYKARRILHRVAGKK